MDAAAPGAPSVAPCREPAREVAMDPLPLYLLLAVTTAPPLVPNSALLVTAGVLAAQGRLPLVLVLVVVAGSALAGDLVMYLLARRFGGPLRRLLERHARSRVALDRAWRGVRRHGLPFVVAVRFLPSGRIVAALTCGVLRHPVRRFATAAAIAESVWAGYSVGLGYLGSAAVGQPLHAVGVGFAVSCAVAGVAVLVGWVGRRLPVRRRADTPAGATAGRPDAAARGHLVRATGARGVTPSPENEVRFGARGGRGAG
ncbi:DedA family protein [Streptomyces sp. NPDC059740]|uniref:DedA family protein n=1 Tax=Streptomyces sp. NPDC059740 TaxID=3346926 RepID=UPI00364E3C58